MLGYHVSSGGQIWDDVVGGKNFGRNLKVFIFSEKPTIFIFRKEGTI